MHHVKEPTPVRPPLAAHPEPPAHAPNAALLIDFDNVTMGIRSDLQNQLRRVLHSEIFRAKISVQRAYADWRRYPQYIVPLSAASIDLIFAPAFGANKKNATDIRLAIDALELVFTRPEIGTFVLLSGDSDFSSLVLKLKEYGKYVIGVGIRDSSSDALIQNCDEYYSYSELTGLTKEGEVEPLRRDPWELVVEAVTSMKKNGDVMRSDRLKQVMLGIDPHFDEKDAGFNRFSKFVVEVGKRGLITLAKLENGQHEVGIGPDANVPPEPVSAGPQDESKESVRRQPRRRAPRQKAGEAAAGRNVTLADAFDLLKRALVDLDAGGEKPATADRVREQMIKISGGLTDPPIFDDSRFQRLLRQARDAEIIDLTEGEGGAYLVEPGSSVRSEGEAVRAPATESEGTSGQETDSAKKVGAVRRTKRARSAPKQSPSGRRKTASGSRRTASSSEATRGQGARRTKSEVEDSSGGKSADQGGTSTAVDEPALRRSPRGSRSAARRPKAAAEGASESPEGNRESSLTSPRGGQPRSIGARKGSRRVRSSRLASGKRAAVARQTTSPPPGSDPLEVDGQSSPKESSEAPAAGGSFLKKMGAALQRVVSGPPSAERSSRN